MIKVNSKNEAWQIANTFVKNDYLDAAASERAGYNIFRSEDEYYNYICDLGDRLEINLKEGNKTINIYIKPNDDGSEKALSTIEAKLDEIDDECNSYIDDMHTLKDDLTMKVSTSGENLCLADFYRMVKKFTNEYERLNNLYQEKNSQWYKVNEIKRELTIN